MCVSSTLIFHVNFPNIIAASAQGTSLSHRFATRGRARLHEYHPGWHVLVDFLSWDYFLRCDLHCAHHYPSFFACSQKRMTQKNTCFCCVEDAHMTHNQRASKTQHCLFCMHVVLLSNPLLKTNRMTPCWGFMVLPALWLRIDDDSHGDSQ